MYYANIVCKFKYFKVSLRILYFYFINNKNILTV